MPTTIPINQVAASSKKVKGDCLFQKILDGGAVESYIRFRNAVTFGIGPTSETTSITGTEVDNYGQTLDSQTEAGDTAVQVTMNRSDANNMAAAMLGEKAILTQGATTVSNEVIGCHKDQFWPLAKDKITDASLEWNGVDLTVTDSSGFTVGELINNTTTPGEIGYLYSKPDATSLFVLLSGDGTAPTATDGIEGATSTTTDTASAVLEKDDIVTVTTDYTLINNNTISIPSTSGIPNGTYKVNYDTPAYTGDQITIGSDTVTKGAFVLTSVNTVDNLKIVVRLRQVNFNPDGIVNLMTGGDDRGEISLSGVAETPDGQTDPGTITFING